MTDRTEYNRLYMRRYRAEHPEYMKRRNEYNKVRYDWLKSKGVCASCAAADAVPGKVYCAGCGARSREYKRLWRERKKQGSVSG